MIKVRIVCVGKLKESYFKEAAAEYEKRLSRFCKLETVELPEKAAPEEEAEEIIRALRGYVFILAVEGKQRSSEEFAAQIRALTNAGREFTFVIGSSCGLDARVKERGELLSFSRMTLPHRLMRVVLLEQIYRAFMIGAGAEYHK